MTDESRTETIKQVHELIRNNDLTEAMRVSGEALAEYDSAWHNSVRSGQPKLSLIADIAAMGTAHVLALSMAGSAQDAFATSLMLLIEVDASKVDYNTILPEARALYSMATQSAYELAMQLQESPGFDAIMTTLSRFASVTYYFYQKEGEAGLESASRKMTYELLSMMKEAGAIQSPTIDVNGTAVEPSSTKEILSDTIALAHSIGLI
jgi:hypothetical protein